MTIKELAEIACSSFEKRQRDNTSETFWTLKQGSPQWVLTMVHFAHGDMMPDDHRYEFVLEAVTAITEFDDLDEARDSLEPDIYNSELTGWLHSRIDRLGYVDDAVAEFGHSETISHLGNSVINDIAMGQLREKEEVFDLVLQFLTEKAEEGA